VVVSVLLLLGTFVWLPLAVISMGLGWFIAFALVAVVLGLFEWRFRNKPLPPVGWVQPPGISFMT
jgi:hypothetical protein